MAAPEPVAAEVGGPGRGASPPRRNGAIPTATSSASPARRKDVHGRAALDEHGVATLRGEPAQDLGDRDFPVGVGIEAPTRAPRDS